MTNDRMALAGNKLLTTSAHRPIRRSRQAVARRRPKLKHTLLDFLLLQRFFPALPIWQAPTQHSPECWTVIRLL